MLYIETVIYMFIKSILIKLKWCEIDCEVLFLIKNENLLN